MNPKTRLLNVISVLCNGTNMSSLKISSLTSDIVILLITVLFMCSIAQASLEDSRLNKIRSYTFHRDSVLGTSFDLTVRGASREQAEACERAVLGEVKRLNYVLNWRDPKSEIGRLAAARGQFKCSADLYSVLASCEDWRVRTSGAFNANVRGQRRQRGLACSVEKPIVKQSGVSIYAI